MLNQTYRKFLHKTAGIWFAILDIIFVNISIFLANYVKTGKFITLPVWGWGQTVFTVHLVCTLLWFLCFYFFELYDRKKLSIVQAIKGSTLAFIIVVFFTFFVRSYAFSRILFMMGWLFINTFVAGWRILVISLGKTELGRMLTQKRTLIVGTGEEAEELCTELRHHPHTEHFVVGFVDTNHYVGKRICNVEVLGSEDELPDLIREYEIDEVIITRSVKEDYEEILELVYKCKGTGVSMKITPDPFEIIIGKTTLDAVTDIPLIDAMFYPVSGWRRTVKRFMDVTMASLGLIILSPIFVMIAIAIKLDSKGPVFFQQERLGKDGKPFMIWKFRSMIADAEKHTGPVWAQKDDPRITNVGRFLRRTSLDEIPQLFCILKGDMSLVGPRPERPYFIKQHKKLQDQRLSVQPGLTGLARINTRYDSTIEERTKYDLYYVRNYSLMLDIQIILRTIWVVMTGKHQEGGY
jgi:exopolysaccharide biosynthesis polyprenyl glycosylphosphotransferase